MTRHEHNVGSVRLGGDRDTSGIAAVHVLPGIYHGGADASLSSVGGAAQRGLGRC